MGGKFKAIAGEIIVARGPWSETLLVCRKCSKKLGGGFGPDGEAPLAGALKGILRQRRLRRTVRVIEVGCLDICPKKGVVVVRGRAPSEMLIVPAGMQDEEVAARLLASDLTPPATAGS